MTKKEYRKLYKVLVKDLSEDERQRRSRLFVAQLKRLLLSHSAKRIGVFMPLKDEADITALYEDLWRAGKELFLPKVLSDTEMAFYAFKSFDELSPSEPYGILEPKGDNAQMIDPNELEIILVSGLAFDSNGYRLGRGKAYYDRYLAKCPNVHTIGLHLALLELENLSPNEWDIPMQEVLKTDYKLNK